MTEPTSNPTPRAPSAATGAAPTAGGMLRAARDAMGMSLDTVAQQLKLAPRQVTALEEDDFARLPGRTFVRGFLRNYARLVRIDPEKVLSALPGGDAPSLDSPALQATAPTIGELPTTEHAKPGWTRWAIPLTLVAVIAAAAIYEFSRGRGDAQQTPAPPPGSSEPERPSPPKPSAGVSETPLPNPIGTPPSTGPGAREPTGAAPGAAAPPHTGAASTTIPPSAAEVSIVLTYRDASWTEVKDGQGQVLVSQMIPGGQTRSIAGVPPLTVVIGNASEVSATQRGQLLDLVPVTQKNVARFIID
jgi:cytoskeleton protein RodZ